MNKTIKKNVNEALNFAKNRLANYEWILKKYREQISKFDNVYLYGSGNYGIRVFDFLRDILVEKKISFVDSDREKWNKILYEDIFCYSIDKIYGCDQEKTIVIISSLNYVHEIWTALFGLRIAGKLGNTQIDRNFTRILDEYFKMKSLVGNLDNMYTAIDLLADEESVTIYYYLLLNRIGITCCMEDVIISHPKYYPEEIKSRCGIHEVYLDCGASNGDTVKSFIVQMHGEYDEIYAFELDHERYKMLSQSPIVQDNRIFLFEAGVSDSNHRVRYSKANCPTYTEFDEEDPYADVVSIDQLIENEIIKSHVTFVKLDVVGAELDALNGMKKMLQRDKPKLAISVYYGKNLFWEVPLFLHSIVPEYKLILRHHGPGIAYTVLYAYIE